ncbi:MAG TPA: hypothetical protein VFE98_04205 [Candidatus Bathyarchaeia archaeon]|nr:hypothetical protein [Candidatus Bathyarchaeia archaeon]
MAQTQLYHALSEAPKGIRRAAAEALICISIARATTILVGTVIIALLPEWFPGLLRYELFPIALLVLLLGSIGTSRKASPIREQIASGELQEARRRSVTAAILGLIFGGVISGILYVHLSSRIGHVMENPSPSDFRGVYMLPQPSRGLFLGRYFGWIAAYLFVLYVGYTQLPSGLRGVSDWLSPVFGVHLNTLVVAVYLVFTNPLTYPPILQLWITAGLLGGFIAGGRVSRGYLVGLSVFLSTLGAMGLAALFIVRNVGLASFPSVPPPPAGFSLTDVVTGPVAVDFLPVYLRASSAIDPSFIQAMLLTLFRNTGLIFAIVTISGRLSCVFWQGGVGVAKFIVLTTRKHIGMKGGATTLEQPALKVAVLLLLLLPLALVPGSPSAATVYQAPPSGPYQQNLAIALDMLGTPNASLRMTNLDLSSSGLTMNSNYAGSTMAVLIVNNNFSESLANIPGSSFLTLVSQPALVTLYTGPTSASGTQSDAVAAQFSQALGVSFTLAVGLPTTQGTVRLYVANPGFASNQDALSKILRLLPGPSFSGLVNVASLRDQKYMGMIGLVPKTGQIPTNGFSFILNAQWPRLFYKAGYHFLSLKSLLGFQNSITGDPAANVSIINVTFQHGTILYSPLFPNPLYNNASSTYILDARAGSRPDFVANFTYPFAPNIIIAKMVTPLSGPVQSSYNVSVNVQNLDIVTVTGLIVTDPQASADYMKTLQASPSGVQLAQAPTFSPGASSLLSYSLTPSSSGTYVLSPASVSFVWRAPNGTQIRYAIRTGSPRLESTSGPITQFMSTLTDLFPYSLLLIVPLLLTPAWEIFKLVGRRTRKRKQRPPKIADKIPTPVVNAAPAVNVPKPGPPTEKPAEPTSEKPATPPDPGKLADKKEQSPATK